MFSDLPMAIPFQHPDCYSAFHLYIIRLKFEQIGKTHRDVFDALRSAGIGVNLHYIPIYLQPYYQRLGFKPGYCPEAERYYAEIISLPMFPALTAAEQDQVVNVLRRAISL